MVDPRRPIESDQSNDIRNKNLEQDSTKEASGLDFDDEFQEDDIREEDYDDENY